MSQGDWAQAADYAEQLLTISRELGDKINIQNGLYALGESFSNSGDNQTGRMYLEQALEMGRREDFPNGIAFALASLARIARLEGDSARAKAYYKECAQIRREMGHRGGLVGTLINLAQVHLEEGDYIQASALSEESLVICRELKIVKAQVYCLAGFASSAGLSGQDGCAARLFGAAEAAAERLDLKMDDYDHKAYDPIITASRERLGEAEFNRLWAEGRKLTLEQALELAQK
jgi:tetratricopeptide (TPR) repeat protein